MTYVCWHAAYTLAALTVSLKSPSIQRVLISWILETVRQTQLSFLCRVLERRGLPSCLSQWHTHFILTLWSLNVEGAAFRHQANRRDASWVLWFHSVLALSAWRAWTPLVKGSVLGVCLCPTSENHHTYLVSRLQLLCHVVINWRFCELLHLWI